jgi:hypothetical protein
MTTPPWIGLLTFYGCGFLLLCTTYSPIIQILSVSLLTITTLAALKKWKEGPPNQTQDDP